MDISMKDVCNQQLSVAKLEAACKQFDKFYRVFIAEKQADVDALQKIGTEITQHLSAHYAGKIELPEKLLDKAERYLGKITTITAEHSQTPATLDERTFLQNMFANIPEAIYLLDDNGRVLAANDAEAQIFGLSAEEMLGKDIFDLAKFLNWKPGIAEKIHENDLLVLKVGKSISFEEETMSPSGESKTFLTHKIPYREESKIIGIMGISIDITAIKKREKNLEDANHAVTKEQLGTNHRLKTILDNLPEAIYWIDEDSVILGCNEAEARIFGLDSADQVIGKNIFDLAKMLDWEPGVAEKLRDNDLRIMKSGQGQLLEEGYITPKGEYRQMLTHKIPYRDENHNVAGIVGISIDITERKKMEEDLKKAKELAESANQAKTEFLNNIRHDTRTPMYGITGSANLLLQQINTLRDGQAADLQEMGHYAHNIINAGSALSAMFDEIIETVRVYDGKLRILHRKFSLHDQLQHIMKFNSPAAEQKNLKLSLEFDDAIPKYLVGDDSIIRRVIQELAVNAIKFTEQGDVSIHAQLLRIHHKTATVQVIVNDTGMGIQKEQQENIFNYFQRLTPAHEGRYSGLGAGLFRVKGYLDKLGADIAVTSQVDNGTTMTCTFPLKIATTQDALHAHWAPDLNKASGTSKQQQIDAQQNHIKLTRNEAGLTNVLLVEDSPSAALVTKGILKNLNCKIDVATSGEDAVKMVQNKTYDFIFMDVGLPGISGIEATQQIRELQEKTDQDIPIVALTAHVEDEAKQACKDAGMNAALSKPLSPEKAEDILNAFIPERSGSQSGAISEATKEACLGSDLPLTEAELFKLDEYALFDLDAAMQTCDNNQALFIEVVQIFLNEGLEEDWANLKKAHEQGDWVKVQDIAHKLKSSALYCGAIRMKMACQYTERYARAGLEKHLEALYQQLLSVIDETRISLKQWLQKQD